MRLLLLPIFLLAAACGTSEAVAGPADAAIGPPITITMSLYVVDDADEANSVLSSQRELADNDGQPDLALFYLTDSNTNEPGIFELSISADTL